MSKTYKYMDVTLHFLHRPSSRGPSKGLSRLYAIKSFNRSKTPGGKEKRTKTTIVTVDPEGTDFWRLDSVVELIKDGAVGIIPTDSYPAFVCDLENKTAAQLLYELKGASPTKKLSILCRNFQDISRYTMGFPVSSAPGQPNFYKIAKQILPGPYTLVLQASKSLPKQVINFDSGTSKKRTTVGVRIPADGVCQAILSQLDRPLLCTTASVEESDDFSTPDGVVFADQYGPRGLGFVVEYTDWGGHRIEPSTVVDLTGPEAVLIRQGKGETASWLDLE